MKCLITGAAGQLGKDVCALFTEKGVDIVPADVADCDITKREDVLAFARMHRPDVIVHCAAYTAVDKAEDESELCYAVNEKGTRNLVFAARETGAAFMYISTDYVFDGGGNLPHKTDEKTNPLSVYGASKCVGEELVKTLSRFYIVRTSWVFGAGGGNFVKTMLRVGKQRPSLQVVDDQIGSPTYTPDLATAMYGLLVSGRYGVYHATNEGYCSWAEFASAIFAAADMSVTVNGIASKDYPVKAVRPLNSRLDKTCLDDAGVARLPHWQDALKRFIELLRKGNEL